MPDLNPEQNSRDDLKAAKVCDGDYTDAELRQARFLTPRVVSQIRKNAGLMRWDYQDVAPGSLADVFWNRDMPRLLRLAEEQVADGR
jgi:hypothetical protein